jgi:alkaline phosphatase
VLLVALVGTLVPAEAARAGDTAVLIGAGDIATCSSKADTKTAALVRRSGAGNVFTVGDNAYKKGSSSEFEKCYAPTWGKFRSKTRPAVGDNEYDTSNAKGYWGYFGSKAGAKGKGWYSYDLESWHIVVLNDNCSEVGGCGEGSEQGEWLKADLAATKAKCIAAIWHTPRFSSVYGNTGKAKDFWQLLYDAGADIVINGHHHAYERFAPQDPSGGLDSGGIRQFLVGTGGAPLAGGFKNVQPNSEVRNAKTFGVLKLKLHPGSYDFKFIPVEGSTFTDSGRGTC